MNSGLSAIFDWLEFTINSSDPDTTILQVLRMVPSEFIDLPKGRYGYKKQKISGHVAVLYDGSDDMGVHIVISGQGCREIEAVYNLLNIFDQVALAEGKFTRVDVAVDDKTGKLVPFDKIKAGIQKGYVRSRWRASTEFIKRNLQDGQVIGNTINVGSKKSQMFLRIYDKAMEQQGKGIHPDPSGQSWIRMELQIRDDRAEKLQNIILFDNDIGKIFSEILNNYLTFLKPSDRDKNKSRWEVAGWWQKIIVETGKLKLTREPEDKTIADVRNWIDKQIAPSLAALILAESGELDDLMEIIINGKKRLKPKHYKMIQSARNARHKSQQE